MLLLSLGLSDCGGHGNPPTIQIVLTNDVASWAPIFIAQSMGYFRQEGIVVATSETASLSKAMQALLGGSVEVAAGSISQAMEVAAEGQRVRCFLSLYTRPAVALAVAPALRQSIRSIRDLKGRPVGVATPGSSMHLTLNYLLTSNGLSSNDVSIISIGTAGNSLAALEHGKVHAAMLVGNAVSAFEKRHPDQKFLADIRTAEGARGAFGSETFPNTALVARENWLRTHADTTRRFVRAVKKAMLWLGTHPAEQVREMVPPEMRGTDIEADLEAIRQGQNTLSPDGMVPARGAELIAKCIVLSNERVRKAGVDLSKVYTNEFAGAQ